MDLAMKSVQSFDEHRRVFEFPVPPLQSSEERCTGVRHLSRAANERLTRRLLQVMREARGNEYFKITNKTVSQPAYHATKRNFSDRVFMVQDRYSSNSPRHESYG
jgi:hypothetical protein